MYCPIREKNLVRDESSSNKERVTRMAFFFIQNVGFKSRENPLNQIVKNSLATGYTRIPARLRERGDWHPIKTHDDIFSLLLLFAREFQKKRKI